MITASHVFLDTNILLRVVTQGQSGCELGCLEELRQFVDERKVVLLISEIVEIEFDKKLRTLDGDIEASFKVVADRVTDALSKASQGEKKIWNELDDVKPALLAHLREIEAKKRSAATINKESVYSLLRHLNAVRLPLDLDILLRGRRRLLAGTMASESRRQEWDCCLVESLVRHFEADKGSSQLLLCTGNVADFGIKLSHGRSGLHPLIQSDLPKAQLFTDLQSLLAFIRNQQAVDTPPAAEIEEALRKQSILSLNARLDQLQKEREALYATLRHEQTLEAMYATNLSEAYEAGERINSVAMSIGRVEAEIDRVQRAINSSS